MSSTSPAGNFPKEPPTNNTNSYLEMAMGTALYITGSKITQFFADQIYNLKIYAQRGDMGTEDHKQIRAAAMDNLKILNIAVDMAEKEKINPTPIIRYWTGQLDSKYLGTQETIIICNATKKLGVIESKKL